MVNISKLMSQVLRHGAEERGIQVRPDGYILLSDLLAVKGMKNLGANINVVKHIVANNDKKRFELKEEGGVMLIRATQGHSMSTVKTEELLTKIENPFEFN